MTNRAALALLTLAACGHTGPAPATATNGTAAALRSAEDVEYPGRDWETGRPEKHGLSEDGLAQLNQVAADLGSTCMVVVHDGVVVSEWYAPGYDRNTAHANLFSVTKSVTSTLVGIAQDEGLLDLTDSASLTIPSWAGTASEGVTVRHLVSNVSGRHWTFESDYVNLLFGADQTAYGIGLGQDVPPDTHWEYNNAAIQTLEQVLQETTGQDVADYAQEKLFEPLGMTATMGRDGAGNPLVYQGVSTSCGDIARFGWLALNGGRWKGDQVVSQSWMDEATSPSTPLNDAYGYMWWLNRAGTVVEPSFPGRVEYDGQLVPGASEDVYAALGAFGQLVVADPADGYVLVRLQDVLDLEQAIATDPDPVGLSKLEAVVTAFDEAKL